MTAGGNDESTLWQVVHDCVETLAVAHADLRDASAIYRALKEEEGLAFDAGDDDALSRITAATGDAFGRRRAAQLRVAEAARVLEDRAARLQTLVSELDENQGPMNCLNEVRQLTVSARGSAEATIADRLRTVTGAIRDRLRSARAEELGSLVDDIRLAMMELEDFGESTTATQEFLQGGVYLDLARAEGRLRLEQELSMLQERIRDAVQRARLFDAEEARDELRAVLGRDGAPDRQVVELLKRALHGCDTADASTLSKDTLHKIARSQGRFQERFTLWLAASECAGGDASGVERLFQVVDSLPTPDESGEGLAEAAEQLLLASGAGSEDAESYWPALESLLRTDGQWAEAIFSVLWGRSPPVPVLARWLLRSDGGTRGDGERLPSLFMGTPLYERAALAAWADARGLTRPVSETPEDLLIADWVRTQAPFPTLKGILAGCRSSAQWTGIHAILLHTVAALNEEDDEALPELPRRVPGLAQVIALLGAFKWYGRKGVAALWDGEDPRTAATRAINALHRDRSPAGGPAKIIWRDRIFPTLSGLRQRAAQSSTRREALAALAELEADEVIDAALREKDIDGVNPIARRRLTEWIDVFRTNVPVEAGGARPGTGVLVLAQRDRLVNPELEVLAGGNALARATEQLLRILLRHPADVQTPAPGVLSPDARGQLTTAIRAAGTAPILSWRLQVASEDSWGLAAGRDALERLAGLAGAARAMEGYVQARRFSDAEACLAFAAVEARAELATTLAAASESARSELRGEIEVFLSAPLGEALRDWPAHSDSSLRERLAHLRGEVDALLDGVATRSFSVLQRETERLDPLVTAACEACRLVSIAGVREVEHYLVGRLTEGLRNGVSPDSRLAVRAFEAALRRDISTAMSFVQASGLAVDDPGRVALEASLTSGSSEPVALPAVRLRPVPEVAAASLGFRFKMSWEQTAPSLHAPPSSSPEGVHGMTHARRLEVLLGEARRLHGASDLQWRNWAGHWALEMAWACIGERDFARAEEHAQDAVRLLVGAATAGGTLTYLDQALTVWIGSHLERSGATLARAHLPWLELRRDAGPSLIRQLIHRFFDSRVVDSLAALVTDASRFGGLLLPRMVAQLDDRERYLRPALLRELLNASVLSGDRIEAAVEVLGRWLAEADQRAARRVLGQLAQLSDEDWAGGDAEARHLEPLATMSLPPEVLASIRDGLAARARSRSGAVSRDARYHVRLLTTLFYRSAIRDVDDATGLVAEVRYEGGPENLGNLQLELTLGDATLAAAEGTRTQRLPVLRRGIPYEVLFPLTLRPGQGGGPDRPIIKVTLLLVALDATGKVTQLQRTMANLKVAGEYPFGDRRTPYVTGKRVNNPTMIKGRERDVSNILDKLTGAEQDNFVLIFGSRRIGKSTLLEKLRLDERVRALYEPVHVDLEDLLKPDADSVCTFLDRVANHIAASMESPAARAVKPPSPISTTDPYSDFKGYLERVSKALPSGRRLLLLFDEFQMLFHEIRRAERRATYGRPDVDLHANLIQSLRHWIQYLPVGFVVAGTRELKGELLGPAQRLFQLGLSVELSALDEASARELVTDPPRDLFSVTPSAVEEICDATNRLPNLIQIVCHQLFIRARNRQQTVVTVGDVRDTLDEVSASAEHFQFLLSPIQASPLRRTIVRALAEIAVDDRRGTVEDIVNHLRVRGHQQAADPEVVAREVEILRDSDLVIWWAKERTFRLRPPLLARHVLVRPEYALEHEA